MNEIRKLWEEVKTVLHYGPNTQPLWQAVIDKLHAFETRIAALEAGLKNKINELLAETETLLFSNIDKAMQAEFKSLVAGFEDKIAALEARIAALEGHPAFSIPPLQPETAPAPAPVASTEPVVLPAGGVLLNVNATPAAQFYMLDGTGNHVLATAADLAYPELPHVQFFTKHPDGTYTAVAYPGTSVAPTEQTIYPDTPAATSAVDSSGAGDPAASPSVNPSPEQAAGPASEQGEHHGE